MLRILVLTLCMAGMTAAQTPPPGAPPASRAPLRRLAMTSPIVVVASVERAERAGTADHPRIDGVLRPVRVLLGGGRAVLVGVVAPPESELEQGATGIFFLSLAAGDGRGERPLVLDAWIPARGRTLAVYEHRLGELLEILDERGVGRRERRTVEWLVQLVEEPATRWEGLLDLAAPADSRRPSERSARVLLDASQRERLLAVLLGEPGLSLQGTALASVIPPDDDGRVERWLWESLNEADDARATEAREAMRVLAKRLDDRTAEGLADALSPAAEAADVRRSVVAFLERLEPRVFPSDGRRTGRRDG